MGSIIMMSMMLVFTGCSDEDDKPEKNLKPEKDTMLSFNAAVLKESGESSSTADSKNGNITLNWTTNITINGETYTISGTRKGNELLVASGNEIEITFDPQCPEETEAFFTLPDGKTQKVTASSPSFKWIVPENFTPGMEIKGESSYETDEAKYKASGKIILIELQSEE